MSRTTIINLIIYVIIFLLLWFGTWPFFKDTRDLKKSITDIKTNITEEKQAIEELNVLKDLVEANRENIESLKLAIPASRDISALLVIFEEASAINGLLLGSIDIGEDTSNQETTKEAGTKTSPVAVVNIKLNLIGNYGQFKNFLGSVEKSLPLMDISDITFKVSSNQKIGEETDDSFNPILDFDVNLNTYYSRQ